MKSVRELLKQRIYKSPPNYRDWMDIVNQCSIYADLITNRVELFSHDPLARNTAMLIINAAQTQAPIYYIGKSIFNGLRTVPVSDRIVSRQKFDLKTAFFIFPQNHFFDSSGASIDWLLYYHSPENDDLSLRYQSVNYAVAPASERVLWCSLIDRTGEAYFTKIDPKNYKESVRLKAPDSAPLLNSDSQVIVSISDLLINSIMYMDTEVYQDVSIGFNQAFKKNERPKTYLYPNWVKPRVIRDVRADKGGHHNSPRPHVRRAHVRRYRDKDGNVIKEIPIRRAIVNDMEGSIETY